MKKGHLSKSICAGVVVVAAVAAAATLFTLEVDWVILLLVCPILLVDGLVGLFAFGGG